MTRLLLALFLIAIAAPAAAQVDSAAKVHAQLIAEHDTVTPGSTVTVALVEDIRPGWHTYWLNPGDAGAPTGIAWDLPPGWRAGAIQWPYPKRLPIPPLMDYGYENNVWLLTDISVPSDAKVGEAFLLKATANWLVCREVCIPEETTITVPVQIAGAPNVPDQDIVSQFAAARSKLPRSSPWPAVFHAGSSLDLFLKAPALASAQPDDAIFFPATAGTIQNAKEQKLGFSKDGLVLRLTPTSGKPPRTLDGVLVLHSADGSMEAIDIHAAPGTVPNVSFVERTGELSLLLALLFAFIGGIILNAMPCVLPVLAMKIVSLAQQSGAERSAARREGFAYSLGAILSFVAFGLLVVVLRAGGTEVGWGFQLQEPIVVAGLALLLFSVGLNLSGIFEFPTVAFGGSFARQSGPIGAFFTGVLAVAVAAPCTAPFMAAALGFALTQSAALAVAVFFALGLGFALPFLLIAIWPAALRFLPKPGAWMLRLKQILALPMYGATLWLLWVLSQQATMLAVWILLAAMLTVGIGAYVWTATRNLDAQKRGFGQIAALVALLAALSGLWIVRGQQSTAPALGASDVSGIPHEAYSEARLSALRAEGRPVFVNATAAWCITCLVNERAVLSKAPVKEAFAKANVTYLVADWTRRDAAITELLRANGRSGVPLYLYYRPGEDARVLPQILTEGALEDAIANR